MVRGGVKGTQSLYPTLIKKVLVTKTTTGQPGGTGWTRLDAMPTDGFFYANIIDNYNGCQWKNVTKGTSGNFTDVLDWTSENLGCCIAAFEVSAGDLIDVYSNSGGNRHLVGNIVID